MRAHMLMDVPLIGIAIGLYPAYGLLPGLAFAAGSSVVHTWGVVNPRSSLYMRVHWRLPRHQQDLALSFDDGPHPEATPRVLDLLAEHGQRATFFCIGKHAERHPELVRRIHAEGHALGLHSHSHSRWFNCWPPGRVRADLQANAAVLADATGEPPPLLWRPPVGLKNPILGHVSGRLGLRPVTWSGRAFDTGATSAEAICERLLPLCEARQILVMHDGCEVGRDTDRTPTLEALAQLLPQLRARGIRSRALQVAARGIDCRQPVEEPR